MASLMNENVFEKMGPKADNATSERTVAKVDITFSKHF